MKSILIMPLVSSMVLLSLSAFAGQSNDTDLGGQRRRVRPAPSLELHADEIRVGQAASLSVEVLREDHGRLRLVEGLGIKVTNPGGCARSRGTARIEAELRNTHFGVTNGNTAYRIVADVPCTGRVQLLFKGDSDGGQALGIWQIGRLAETKLEANIGLSFWKTNISFVWPADADYYNWGSVHITRGDHWDVAGHELGHAIYDLGSLGGWGGGEHFIDRCYSDAMALSEGWASFFSAWLSVTPNDPDAKFEFMVPRRAPIRFETVPADVCRGETNEWRVTGFFWDLYDLNNDGETATESFANLWRGLFGTKSPSASAARQRLAQSGIHPDLLDLAWKLNF